MLIGLIPFIYLKVRFVVIEDSGPDEIALGGYAFMFITTVIITMLATYLSLSEVYWLEKKLPWKHNIGKRIFAELMLTNATIIMLMMLTTKFVCHAHEIFGIKLGMSFKEHLFGDITMGVVLNMILVLCAEGVFFFNQWKDSVVLSERLQKENMHSQLEVLKGQVNPHFLFNSLNVLSSLVHKDADKAEEFIDEFASVYRYILNIQSKTVVTLKEELHFLDSYIFLQKIRFKDGLKMHLHIDAEQLSNYLPPLALQMLVENAIKHNVVGKEKPLNIKIFTKGQTLHIVNNLQIRKDDSSGTGMGLKNLRSRYFRLAGLQPKFECRDTEYVAIIPLFSSDQEPMMQTESLKDEATMEAPVKSFKCHSFRHGFFRNHCKKNSKN